MDFTLQLNLLNFLQQYGRLKPCHSPHCHYKHLLILQRQYFPSGLKLHLSILFMEDGPKNILILDHASALMDWDRIWHIFISCIQIQCYDLTASTHLLFVGTFSLSYFNSGSVINLPLCLREKPEHAMYITIKRDKYPITNWFQL